MMALNDRKTASVALSLGLSLSIGLVSCDRLSTGSNQNNSMNAASPKPSGVSQNAAGSSASPSPGDSGSAAVQSASPQPQKSAASKPPLTVQKLKNATYYILSEGPVTLKDGKYQDKQNRTFTLGDVVAYGDLNKDGIKDAIAPLTITINDRTFTYLVGLINEAGTPKNTVTEFLGEGVTVTSLAANAGKIDVKMDKCCPNETISQGFSFNQIKAAQKPSPSKSPTEKTQPSPAGQ